MRWIIFLLMLTLVLPALAQPDTQAAEKLRQTLEGYLAGLDPNMTLAGNPAEEGFIALGKDAVPVMQDMSRELSLKLAAAEADGRREEILRLRFQLLFLDRVLVRQATDLNPPAEIRAWVRQHYPPETQYLADLLPEPARLTDETLARIFPGYLFYAANFRHYPMARNVPPPLGLNNLFAVRLPVQPENGKGLPFRIVALTNSTDLRLFFLETATPLRIVTEADPRTEEATMKAVTRAWLVLSQVLQDDGFYRLTIPEESLQVAGSGADAGGYLCRGRAEVLPAHGDSGSINTELYFSAALLLIDVKEVVKLTPGLRPGG